MTDTALLCCPHCGGEAELDTDQSYRALSDGSLGSRAVVYCTRCGADMGFCYEDARGTPREDIVNQVVDDWNRRASPSQRPSVDVVTARPNWNGWRSIDTAPEDCRVILATAGNWVGEAIMLRDEDTGEQVWTWVDSGKPSLFSCYGWKHLPEPLLAPVLSDLRPDGFDGPTGAE